jgi:hypothetical protein
MMPRDSQGGDRRPIRETSSSQVEVVVDPHAAVAKFSSRLDKSPKSAEAAVTMSSRASIDIISSDGPMHGPINSLVFIICSTRSAFLAGIFCRCC